MSRISKNAFVGKVFKIEVTVIFSEQTEIYYL